MNKKSLVIFRICLSGLCISLGLVVPFLTGQIPEIGNMLCPMHIPIIICGFICGYKYGLIVGFITPLLRSFIFNMPTLYPAAISMSVELATYGFISGLLYYFFFKLNKNSIYTLYITLISSMLIGRIIWGITRFLMALIDNSLVFSFKIFLTGAFITAWPGIILQLVLIPAIILSLEKADLIKRQCN